MDRSTAQKILEILKAEFDLPDRAHMKNRPFETLIKTILSQSTTSVNTERSFKRLTQKFKVSAEVLAHADIKEIEEAIQVGGLQRNKAKVIKTVSKKILEKFGGDLNFIYKRDIEEARKLLMSLPGVGPKTCDVTLLFSAGRPVMPIDTHIKRVSVRLGLSSEKTNYEETREILQNLFPAEEYLTVHLALIALGREYCRARNPRCSSCPIRNFCPYASKTAVKERIKAQDKASSQAS